MDKKHATLHDDQQVIPHAPRVVSEKGMRPLDNPLPVLM